MEPSGLIGAELFLSSFVATKLVGAVGIENTTERNLKELEEMLGSAKELKRIAWV